MVGTSERVIIITMIMEVVYMVMTKVLPAICW